MYGAWGWGKTHMNVFISIIGPCSSITREDGGPKEMPVYDGKAIEPA